MIAAQYSNNNQLDNADRKWFTNHSSFTCCKLRSYISGIFLPNLDKVSLENTAMVDMNDLQELKEIRLKDSYHQEIQS